MSKRRNSHTPQGPKKGGIFGGGGLFGAGPIFDDFVFHMMMEEDEQERSRRNRSNCFDDFNDGWNISPRQVNYCFDDEDEENDGYDEYDMEW